MCQAFGSACYNFERLQDGRIEVDIAGKIYFKHKETYKWVED